MAILITASINIYAARFQLRAAVDDNARRYTEERSIRGVRRFDHAIMRYRPLHAQGDLFCGLAKNCKVLLQAAPLQKPRSSIWQTELL